MSKSSSRRPQRGSKLVLAFFLSSTLLVAIIYSKVLAAVMRLAGLTDTQMLGRDLTQSTMLALVFTVVTLLYTLKATSAKGFIDQVSEELVKVTWPTFDESKANTTNTIVVTLIIGAILFSFDTIFGGLTDLLLISRPS
jgi:preprotein translocase subunit SecE